MNSSKGWLPFYFDCKNKKFVTFKDYYAPKGTENIEIEIEANPLRKVFFSLNFKNSDLISLKSFNTEIDASHILIYENNKVKIRFFRFCSLISVEKDNQNDGTYMIDGKFTKLNIVKNNINETWGIPGDNIEVSWLISSKRINFSYDNEQDNFSIIHKKNPSIDIK